VKSRRLRPAGHEARTGEARNAYNNVVEKPLGKRLFERPERRWEDNIKMDVRGNKSVGKGSGWVHDCLFSIFAVTLHDWRTSLHLLPEDAPCRSDKGPTQHGL